MNGLTFPAIVAQGYELFYHQSLTREKRKSLRKYEWEGSKLNGRCGLRDSVDCHEYKNK